MTQSPNKTILVIIHSYLPGTTAGGPVRTTSNMVQWLGPDYQFRILTMNQDFKSSEPYPNIEAGKWYDVGLAKVRYLFPEERSPRRLARIISAIPCDMIYVDGVFATLGIEYLCLRRLGAVPDRPTVLVPRGMLGAGALQIKAFKKRLYLTLARLTGLYRNLHWHASSDFEAQEIRAVMGASPEAISAIPNLPDPALLAPDLAARPPKQVGEIRQLTLSRISRKKNILFMLQVLQEVDFNVQYDVYGHMEDPAYWQECERLIATLPENVSVRYCGAVNFDEVIATFSQYHLFALPTLHENFGHVILEALCSGCAILISDQTPWRDLEEKGVGWELPLEPAAFAQALRHFAALNHEEFASFSTNAHNLGTSFIENTGHVEATRKLFADMMQPEQ